MEMRKRKFFSPNITFLLFFLEEEKNDSIEFFGFWHYENEQLKEGHCFTLVVKFYAKYFIVEKKEPLKEIKSYSNMNKYFIKINLLKNLYIFFDFY